MFWTTGGGGDGSAYTQTQLYQMFRRMFTSDNQATEGVLYGFNNGLAVSGTSSPVTIATGGAVVSGFLYENDSSTTQAISTPTLGTTGHRIVLRASWAAQTVRIALLSSANGVSSIPALTQTAGTTWEISLATIQITTGGVITVTDDRSYCHFATRVSIDQIDLTAAIPLVTNTFPAISVSGTGADEAISLINTGAGGRNYRITSTSGVSGYGQGALAIVDESVPATPRLLIDSSGNVLGINRPLMPLVSRQGGHATLWGNAGTTDYAPTNSARMMVGSGSWSGAAAASGTVTVNLPVSYSGDPLAWATARADKVCMTTFSASASSVIFHWSTTDGSTIASFGFCWQTIGP